MISRFSQIARHLSRPLPNYVHRSAVAVSTSNMTSSLPIRSAPGSAHAGGKSTIHTAGCIIIGDEVLGGKTVDSNSAWFAKFCFNLGMQLRRVEVIADDEEEIVEATRRMSKNYDFVVTSGGIGPTHDDITYQSIAKAFDLPLKLHDVAFEKMKTMSKSSKTQPNFDWTTPSPTLKARLRMVELPYDDKLSDADQVIFPREDLWVPVAVINGNIHILPGVPRLFEGLLEGMKPMLLPRMADPEGKGTYRMLFSTPLPESAVAEYLTQLAAKVKDKNIKVGSYPRWGKKRNVVTLVGTDREYMDSLIGEVEKGVEGKHVLVEGEDDTDSEEDLKKDGDA